MKEILAERFETAQQKVCFMLDIIPMSKNQREDIMEAFDEMCNTFNNSNSRL